MAMMHKDFELIIYYLRGKSRWKAKRTIIVHAPAFQFHHTAVLPHKTKWRTEVVVSVLCFIVVLFLLQKGYLVAVCLLS